MPVNKPPEKHAHKRTTGFYEMKVDQKPLVFPYEKYGNLKRMANYYKNKYDRVYTVRVVKNKQGIKQINVYREK